MDFTLALTHFCEVHGPKSVLCTQVLPLECAVCLPPSSPSLRAQQSFESFATQVQSGSEGTASSATSGLRKTDTNCTIPTSFSGATTVVDSGPPSPNIERHHLFRNIDHSKDFGPQFKYGRAQGETCASCSFTVPQDVASKLPAGAPGSVKADGKSKNGAPVLRSRETVCMGSQKRRSQIEPSSSQESETSSTPSFTSAHSHSDCHDHVLTYLTAKSPDDQESFAQLRASVIRALSCEVLPRGMSDGPFCFGDSNVGYTIAYVFRLTDPKARGRRRAYAFVALAGTDASRAFKACPTLWEAFAAMAKSIEQRAQHFQEDQQRREETERAQASRRNHTPVTSFLTQRAVDPDGHPRRAGQTQPRSLAEIVGNDNIFAVLHKHFVTLLRCLGDKFGGLPLAEPSVYQTLASDQGIDSDHRSHVFDKFDKLRMPDDSGVLTPLAPVPETDTKIKMKRRSQCAPIAVGANSTRPVAV